jgi:hypothetical protein
MRAALLLLAVLPMGCKQLPDFSDLKRVLPTVRFDTMKIEDLDFERMEARFVLEVDNPYPVELDLTETSWKLGLAGHPFLDGTNREGTTIAANGKSKVRIPFTMRFADAFRVVGDAQGEDELPYTLDATLGFATPVGPVSVPLNDRGQLPALHLPQVSLQGLKIDRLDLEEGIARLTVDLDLDTDQGSPLSFQTFGYGLSIAGAEVATGNARIGNVANHADVELPVVVSLQGVGDAVLGVLADQRRTKVELVGDATVGTPFGDVPLHVDETADLTPR